MASLVLTFTEKQCAPIEDTTSGTALSNRPVCRPRSPRNSDRRLSDWLTSPCATPSWLPSPQLSTWASLQDPYKPNFTKQGAKQLTLLQTHYYNIVDNNIVYNPKDSEYVTSGHIS